MQKQTQNGKWTTAVILKSLLTDVRDFCEDQTSGFSNPTQFINYAVRRELEIRKRGY